jgi:hypothetical protein
MKNLLGKIGKPDSHLIPHHAPCASATSMTMSVGMHNKGKTISTIISVQVMHTPFWGGMNMLLAGTTRFYTHSSKTMGGYQDGLIRDHKITGQEEPIGTPVGVLKGFTPIRGSLRVDVPGYVPLSEKGL